MDVRVKVSYLSVIWLICLFIHRLGNTQKRAIGRVEEGEMGRNLGGGGNPGTYKYTYRYLISPRLPPRSSQLGIHSRRQWRSEDSWRFLPGAVLLMRFNFCLL
jgi:hypothetical protein